MPGDTSYLFAIGGKAGTTALGDVLRAQVLRNLDAPSITAITRTAGGNIDAGTYYYKVSAITLDPKNPGGETLASDEEPVTLDAAGQVTLTWTCAASASKFRVYRTSGKNQASGSETLLSERSAACSGGVQAYTDGAAATTDPRRPLPRGALGVWVPTVALATPRFQAAARLAGNDLYVVGGCTSGAGCTSTASVERIAFASGTSFTPLAPVSGGALQTARDRHALALTDSTSGSTGGSLYLFAFGGTQNGAEITRSGIGNTVEVSAVTPGGALSFVTPTGQPQNLGYGGWAEAVANQAFYEMTSGGGLNSKSSGFGAASVTSTNSFSFNFNAGFPGYTAGGDRYLLGEQLFRAYVYAVGGFASPTTLTPTSTVERVVY